MEALQSWDRKQNRGLLRRGSKWYLRHNKRFRVRVTSFEGNLVKYTAMRGKRERSQTVYGFLTVYKPV